MKLCGLCQCDNPWIALCQGAEKPIYSADYRDHFQVDLINMGHNPQKNTYGIEMKWILTMKDHFSGYAVLHSIPSKLAKCVACELNYLFGNFGFPQIFHTDNGNEFTAQEVLKWVESYHSAVITAKGCPCTTREQRLCGEC